MVETGGTNLRAVAQANPIRPRYAKVKAANLPELLKPEIGGEAMSRSTRRAFRGGWGQRAGKDQPRNLGDPAERVENPTAQGNT
jgi:hypothetical protein